MAKLKNLSLITVLLADVNASIPELTKTGLLVNTSNPLLAGIPLNGAAIHGLATTMSSTYINFKSVPATATSQQVAQKKSLFITGYNKDVFFVQSAARDLAISTGSVQAGIDLVLTAGLKIKNAKGATTKGFKVTPAGIGAVDITTKAVAVHAGYVRQIGTTTAKGVPPLPENCLELLITLETDLHIENLKSVTVYGLREASVITISRKAKSGTPTNDVEKMATPIKATKAHKQIFNAADVTHYNWGEWIYVVVQ